MSERVRINFNDTDFLFWLLCEACPGKEIEKIASADAAMGQGQGKFDVRLTINDVEFPVTDTLKSIEGMIDQMVEKRAIELLNTKLQHISDSTQTVMESTDELVKKARVD